MKSVMTVVAAGFAASMIAAGAFASPVEYYQGSTPATVSSPAAGTLGSINDTFSGPAVLSRRCLGIPINLNCTLTLTGAISDLGSEQLGLEITAGSSTGPGLCSAISFPTVGTTPWTASTSHASIPADFATGSVPFSVNDVVVATSCGNCSGDPIAAEFNNVNSSFSFSGTIGACSVSSNSLTTTSGDYYSVRH